MSAEKFKLFTEAVYVTDLGENDKLARGGGPVHQASSLFEYLEMVQV